MSMKGKHLEKMEVKLETADSHKFLSEFINLYKLYPCLWKYSCKDYRNRFVKEKAYSRLVDKMREVDPRADKNSVMRKINALRTTFRREFKKVRRAESIAKNTGNKYPKKRATQLWYYDLLKFVVEQQDYCVEPPPGSLIQDWCAGEQPTSESSGKCFAAVHEDGKVVGHDVETLMEFLEDTPNMQQTEVKVEQLSPSSSRPNSPTINKTSSTSGHPLSLEIDEVFSQEETSANPSEQAPAASRTQVRKLPQLHPLAQQPQQPQQQQQQQQQVPEAEPADFDSFSAYVESKLKRSSRKQSIIAEKVIADVLMRANLGTLNETTTLTDT